MKTTPLREHLKNECAYTPLPFFVMRRPLYPLGVYLAVRQIISSNASPQALHASLPDSSARWFEFAIAVGSHVFFEQARKTRTAGAASAHVNRTLFRYLNRMSTRPTPYGSFAAVSLGNWNDATKLKLDDSDLHTRSRLDMGWLLELCMTLQSRPDVLPFLKVVVNPALLQRGQRVFLGPGLSPAPDAKSSGVSIRATNVVSVVQKVASEPILYASLMQKLCESFPDASPDRFGELVQKLVHNGMLLTDLIPPLAGGNPAQHVIERLSTIPACAPLSSSIESVSTRLADLDQEAPPGKTSVYCQIIEQLRSIHRPKDDAYVQVDMSLCTDRLQIAAEVGRRTAMAAELLLRSSRFPNGPAHLDDFRRRFLHRYGEHREVQLIELLDPKFGLDYSKSWSSDTALGPDAGSPHRHHRQALLDLACEAVRAGQREIAIKADEVDVLFPPLVRTSAPSSLDLFVSVAATSEQALDAGDFDVIVGPRCGEIGAGRSLARFADMFGKEGESALALAMVAEGKRSDVAVELDYLPTRLRSANVAVRPAVAARRVQLGCGACCSDRAAIPLNEISVGVEDERFYLRWVRSGERIHFISPHMLNGLNDSLLAQFLLSVSSDRICQLHSFGWGHAESLPFTPRLRVERVILAPATWRINAASYKRDFEPRNSHSFFESLRRWRAIWNVARHVYLADGDNRLLLDLEDEYEAEEIRLRLLKMHKGSSERWLLIQEMLPDFEHCWLGDGKNTFSCELVVSLTLQAVRQGEKYSSDQSHEVRPILKDAGTPSSESAGDFDVAASEPDTVCSGSRQEELDTDDKANGSRFGHSLKVPGSDWLYLKIYCPDCFHDDILSGPILDFANTVLEQQLVYDWFFLRYTDPDLHIRVRFHGDPRVLTSTLYPAVCEWARGLIQQQLATRVCFDTYEREIETFGGPSALSAIERFFSVDSQISAQLLRLRGKLSHELGLMLLAMRGAEDIFSGLAIDDAGRRPSEELQKASREWSGEQYRQHKTVLRSLMTEMDSLGSAETCEIFRSLFDQRSQAIRACHKRLDALQRRNALSRPMSQIAWKLVHLHCNRLLGLDRQSEFRVLGLLHRIRKSLREYS